MNLLAFAFPLAWFTLVGAPVFALVVSFNFKLSSPLNVVRAVIFIALVALAWALSVEFCWRPLNWLSLAGAYLGWALLIGAVFRIRPRLLGALLGSLGVATFVPGLALGTIGILGLFFILADYAKPPARSVTLAPGLNCIVTNWGNVTSDDGHDVHLYRYFTWFPLLRHQVRHVIVDETNPRPGVPASVGCEAVAAGRVT